MEHIKDAIPFQEKLVLQGVCEKDTVRVYTGLDELTVGVINSRKLSVRGIISVELYGEREENLEVAQRIDDKDVEQLMGQMKVLKLDSVVRDIVRIKNVVTLPKTKPNICKLISSLVDMRNLEYTYERDHITLTGECHACIVYLSEEQEICCFEVQEGFQMKYTARVIMPEILPGFAHSLPCIRLRRKMITTESSGSFRLRQHLRWMERSGVRKQ